VRRIHYTLFYFLCVLRSRARVSRALDECFTKFRLIYWESYRDQRPSTHLSLCVCFESVFRFVSPSYKGILYSYLRFLTTFIDRLSLSISPYGAELEVVYPNIKFPKFCKERGTPKCGL